MTDYKPTDVTLYCDASWYAEESVGGWAVWVRSTYGRIVRAGVCPDYLTNSYEAEIAAIFAGLHLTTKAWPELKSILVRSDCTGALRALENPPRSPGGKRLHSKIVELRQEHGLKLIPAWVRGHQGGSRRDAWLNRKVDEMAKDKAQSARRR